MSVRIQCEARIDGTRCEEDAGHDGKHWGWAKDEDGPYVTYWKDSDKGAYRGGTGGERE